MLLQLRLLRRAFCTGNLAPLPSQTSRPCEDRGQATNSARHKIGTLDRKLHPVSRIRSLRSSDLIMPMRTPEIVSTAFGWQWRQATPSVRRNYLHFLLSASPAFVFDFDVLLEQLNFRSYCGVHLRRACVEPDEESAHKSKRVRTSLPELSIRTFVFSLSSGESFGDASST